MALNEPLSTSPEDSLGQSRKHKRLQESRRRHRKWVQIVIGVFAVFFLFVGSLVGVAFKTSFGNHYRLLAAETIASTRHYQYARFITTPSEYTSILKNLNSIVVKVSDETGISLPAKPVVIGTKPQANPVQVLPISEDGYNGCVMLVKDPKLVRLVPAEVTGTMGEYITHMAARVGAIAGINASGFADPKGSGWGGVPVGMEYVGGAVKQSSKLDESWATVGFTKEGILVMGDYNETDLHTIGAQDAMQFHPELIVNGQPTITEGDGGWGADPRTAIGQAKDGTVIFVVINGRLRGHGSIGATQRQVMDIMLRYHAYNACAMDGGSSSVMYSDGKVINSPSTVDPNGQRHLPDAWMVFPSEQAAAAVGDPS